MTDPAGRNDADAICHWWRTAIIDMAPGRIAFRGHPIQDLIGSVSFAQMIWLMVRGDMPTPEQAALFECALVAGVDHGPQAPSIAAARMAATCGLGLNNVIATGVNMLGDVHGGAGEQAVALYRRIERDWTEAVTLDAVVEAELDRFLADENRYLPGFGHRFHPTDPRAPKLLGIVDAAAARGTVSGRFAGIARALESALAARKGKRIPMNIDGATAVIYAELGFAPELARGLFCLSRSVGILAHAWEQQQQGGRNKGPLPKEHTWAYEGIGHRPLPDD